MMGDSKHRVEIPAKLVRELMVANRRTCCVCHEPNHEVQTHHIDGDPSVKHLGQYRNRLPELSWPDYRKGRPWEELLAGRGPRSQTKLGADVHGYTTSRSRQPRRRGD